MTQMGFFDVENRYASLDAKNDPLVKINALVPPAFAGAGSGKRSEAAWSKSGASQPTSASRTQVASHGTPSSFDRLRMFKAIILCALYNLSDDQVEYQMRDRLSFVRFLGLALEDKVPNAETVWLYREHLSQAGVLEALFNDFDGYLSTQGFRAMGGQIIDALIVAVPIQRNGRDDNAQIKQGELPEAWADKAAKGRQKSLPPA